MMQIVSDAMATGFSAAEVKTLSQWIVSAAHAPLISRVSDG